MDGRWFVAYTDRPRGNWRMKLGDRDAVRVPLEGYSGVAFVDHEFDYTTTIRGGGPSPQ
jgi:hypothetical protein